MLNRVKNLIVVVAVPAFMVVAAGCGGTVEAQPATAESAVARAPVATSAHGPVKMIGLALGEVPLRAAQRAEIEKLAADSDARHAGSQTARKELSDAVAAQVEQGKIDRAALQPKIDAVAAAWEASRPGDRAGLERLHALLDAGQRAAFVSALEAKMQDGKRAHGRRAEMQSWATDLKLTDDQKTALRDLFRAKFDAARAEHSEHGEHGAAELAHGKAQGKKMLEAFKGDRFVMDEVAPKVDVRARTAKISDRMLGMVETALPVLTPEQRTLAAQKIRARGDAHDVEL